jgi:hypothetical protein
MSCRIAEVMTGRQPAIQLFKLAFLSFEDSALGLSKRGGEVVRL